MGRKRHKYDDYVDLGAGYDENDSFIDNTDVVYTLLLFLFGSYMLLYRIHVVLSFQYDEIVPEEMTTAHGGFYINCGPLEFKTAENHSVVQNNNNNNNNNNNQSNDDESSESSEDDTEDVDSPKRSEKRAISSSDEDDTEDITTDQPRKVTGISNSSLFTTLLLYAKSFPPLFLRNKS